MKKKLPMGLSRFLEEKPDTAKTEQHAVETTLQHNSNTSKQQPIKMTFYFPPEYADRFHTLWLSHSKENRKVKKTALAADIFGKGMELLEKETQ